jgi:hypothetical protein
MTRIHQSGRWARPRNCLRADASASGAESSRSARSSPTDEVKTLRQLRLLRRVVPHRTTIPGIVSPNR